MARTDVLFLTSSMKMKELLTEQGWTNLKIFTDLWWYSAKANSFSNSFITLSSIMALKKCFERMMLWWALAKEFRKAKLLARYSQSKIMGLLDFWNPFTIKLVHLIRHIKVSAFGSESDYDFKFFKIVGDSCNFVSNYLHKNHQHFLRTKSEIVISSAV